MYLFFINSIDININNAKSHFYTKQSLTVRQDYHEE